MSWTRSLRKLRHLPAADRLLLLQAVACLMLLRLGVAVVPLRRLAPCLGLTPGESPAGAAVSDTGAGRIAWAITAAAARLPWAGTCLVQALVGAVLLRRRGLPATVYLGVAKSDGTRQSLSAHAWLRSGGAILTGAAGHERFSPIAAFSTGTHRSDAGTRRSSGESP